MPIEKNFTAPSLALIIPCYNEVPRLDHLITELTSFSKEYTGEISIILVDDGSTDATHNRLHDLAQKNFPSGDCHVIGYQQNRGKGYALREGIAKANAQWLLTLDADLSAHPQVFVDWLNKYELSEQCVYIGSREHPNSKLEFSKIRRVSGRLFNWWIRMNTGIRLKDTQCGFKCYPKKIGKLLFADLKNFGWSHDVEILYRAERLGLDYKALPLTWKHEEHSKLSLLKDGIGSALEIRTIKKIVDGELKKNKSNG